jgi:hypothetical protein
MNSDGTDVSKFTRGYLVATDHILRSDSPNYKNPFVEGTEEHKGYEAAVYDFTQK